MLPNEQLKNFCCKFTYNICESWKLMKHLLVWLTVFGILDFHFKTST